MQIYNVIIIGSGPAGYTAAIYTARANLDPLVLCGYQPGGQLTLTSEVENFPGFPDGIVGPSLIEKMQKQAEKFGAALVYKDSTGVDFSHKPFKVMAEEEEYYGRSVVIATGSSVKMLDVPGEKQYMGRGVSTCATCDAAFFKNKRVAVVGGGDSALEESLFISRFACVVYLIHRRDKLRGSKIMQERVLKNEKIQCIWNSVVVRINGDRIVNGIEIKNMIDNSISVKELEGVFVAIGHQPNTGVIKQYISVDDHGYIIADASGKTNIPGIFAAGDVKDHKYRQAITAAGSGCIAALEVEQYLSNVADAG